MRSEDKLLVLEAEVEALRQENRLLRRQALRILMERAIFDDEMSQNIVHQISSFYPASTTPWYVCILFFGNPPAKDGFPADAPLTVLDRAFRETLAEFGQPCFFDAAGTVACLLNVADRFGEPGEDFFSALSAALTAVHASTMAVTDTAYITVSRPSRLTEGPKPLYRGAMSASAHRTDLSPAVCVEPLPVTPNRQDRYQLLSLEQTFWRQIQMRAFFSAAVTLDQMIQFSQQERGTLDKSLAAVFSRMELVVNISQPSAGPETAEGPDLQALLNTLSQVKSYQEMRNVAYDILATLEDRVYTPANARNRKMPAIEDYIKKNFREQSLDANSIAAAFRISPPYLSRIFKADMGIGLVDYIHKLRIEAAKELLRSPELTVDRVASQVGFSNRGALTRVFKSLEGMTPGAYRDALQQTSQSETDT